MHVYLNPVFTIIVMASSDTSLNCIFSEKYYKLKRFLYKMHVLQCNILTKCYLLTELESDSLVWELHFSVTRLTQ